MEAPGHGLLFYSISTSKNNTIKYCFFLLFFFYLFFHYKKKNNFSTPCNFLLLYGQKQEKIKTGNYVTNIVIGEDWKRRHLGSEYSFV